MWTSNDCSLKKKKRKRNRNWKTKQIWSETWAIMQLAQHWKKLKSCALPIIFSFFLNLSPEKFAGLSLVFSYRTLHRVISWACRMKNHLSPSSLMVKCQSKYLWAVKVDFWWTGVIFLSRATCAADFMCLETSMFPLPRTQISWLTSLSGIFYSCFCSLTICFFPL